MSEKLTNMETAMANAMVRPKLRRKRPAMPGMNDTGMNTAISESVVARTGRPISRVASTAAGKGLTPFSSMKRTMFSSTTMASSMTMPTASASASSVRKLRVKPATHIIPKVPMMEMGIASAAMIVLRTLPRKSSTTSAASSAPTTRCSLTAPMPVRITAELSRTTSSLVPSGSERSTSARCAFTASTTLTVFLPDCLTTERTTVRSRSSWA